MRSFALLALLVGCGQPTSDQAVGSGPRDAEVDACVPGTGRCTEQLEICREGEWRGVGACPEGSECSAGACLPVGCAASCEGRECGCNGLCGLCPAGQTCSADGRCGIPGSRCGDGRCLDDEDCASCPADCACPAGEICSPSTGTCGACVAQCGGRVCGDDGCGGECGECDGRCVGGRECVPCEPRCEGRDCGDDGCGRTCGECDPGATCSDAGVCVVDCVPDCGGKVCGGDGCGGACGRCAVDETCEGGRCVPDEQVCGDRVCAGDETCRSCQADCGVCCGNGVCQPELDEGCVSCPVDCACTPNESCDEGLDRCVTLCVPQCEGRVCGPDGCGHGGTCGECEPGFGCDQLGRCL